VLDAEDAHAEDATARASLVGLFAPAPVVVEVALRCPHADVARAVELGADLADLGLDELVVVDERVLAGPSVGVPGISIVQDRAPKAGMSWE